MLKHVISICKLYNYVQEKLLLTLTDHLWSSLYPTVQKYKAHYIIIGSYINHY